MKANNDDMVQLAKLAGSAKEEPALLQHVPAEHLVGSHSMSKRFASSPPPMHPSFVAYHSRADADWNQPGEQATLDGRAAAVK